MNPRDHIPQLHTQAAIMLPGLKQARALMDVTIRTLEYFERYAARDVATGTSTVLTPPPASLMKEVDQLKAVLSAFGHLHDKRK